ncbi:hypothetical protein F4820DRAFT_411677 [Hypoxylon rubiginosum]|uniref:Uncharacterized protein n=1 Tax=Hypoxylon rubiginosum TaxID=110542 RepID=A0ACB9Z8H2_9PEZI|nr:hypothetical protein F4820DRAFT_411677 [Hypoxylon rubiginosum]
MSNYALLSYNLLILLNLMKTLTSVINISDYRIKVGAARTGLSNRVLGATLCYGLNLVSSRSSCIVAIRGALLCFSVFRLHLGLLIIISVNG